MLSPIEKFLIGYGIRNADYLGILNIHKEKDVVFPRNVVYHYLTQLNDKMFPNRNDYFYNGMSLNKKLKIAHKEDLTEKEGTTTFKNRYLGKEIREWHAARRRTFRKENLPEDRNKDNETIATINYNTVKSLYNYRSSAMTNWFYRKSITKTYIDGVVDALRKDQLSYHFITLEIPNVIPTFQSTSKLLKYEPLELSRLLTEPSHYLYLELYKWLSYKDAEVVNSLDDDDPDSLEEGDIGKGLRTQSMLSSVTDQDSTRIVIELKYRGYVTYVPLSVLRGISEDSKLPSSKSFKDLKTRKFFIAFLYMIQNAIVTRSDAEDKLLNTDDTDEAIMEDNPDVEFEEDEDYEEELEDDGIASSKPETMLDRVRKRREEKRLRDEARNNAKRDISKDVEEPISDSFYEIEDIFTDLEKYGDSDNNQFDKDVVDKLDKRTESRIKHSITNDVEEEGEDESLKDLEVMDEDDEPVAAILKSTTLTKEEKRELIRSKNKEEYLDDFIEEGKIRGTITPAEIRSLRNAQEKRKRLTDPISGLPLDKVSTLKIPTPKLNKETTGLTIDNDLVDETFKENRIQKYDSLYIKEKLHADLMSVITDVEKAGYIITDIKANQVKSSVDNYETYHVTMKPFKGKTFTIPVRIPTLYSDGTFMVGGVNYRFRKQDSDLPIRKISPIRVALSSNLGRFFISRKETKAYSPARQLYEFVTKDYLNGAQTVKKIVPGIKELNKEVGLPNDYVSLAVHLDALETDDYNFTFTPEAMVSSLKPEMIKAIKKSGKTYVGTTKKGDVLLIGTDNIITNNNTGEEIGTFFDVFGFPPDRVAKGFSVMKVLGMDIPLGPIMCFYMGLSNFIHLTDTSYRLIPSNKRVKLERNEYEIRFSDYRLVLSLDTEEKKLLFQGFEFYRDFVKTIAVGSLDKKDVYLDLFESKKAKAVHLKQLEFLVRTFLDSITVDVLTEMGEPTEYFPLLLRANELLKDYSHPDMGDPYYSRFRGYDRFPGLAYRAIMGEVRNHFVRDRPNSKPQVDNYLVWNTITQDQSKGTQVILNPIASIKEEEIVTLTGQDGLSSGAVSSKLRRYHENDAGLISEATVDSKDVAVTKYLSSYAKLDNVRGMVSKNFDALEENPAKVYSTSNQLKPMTEYDDQIANMQRSSQTVMSDEATP